MTVHPADPGHVAPELLADRAEGLLSAGDEAVVRAHLDSCPHCRQVDAELREVSALLAAHLPARMPDDVAARLEAALQAEPPLSVSPPTRAATATAAPASRPRSRTRRMPVWVGAAAATVLGVTGAVIGVRALDSGESTSGAGTALEADRAAEAPESALAVPAAAGQYSAATLAAQVAALVTGTTEDVAEDSREAAPGTLPEAGAAAEPSSPTGQLSALATLATPEGLAACVASLTGREGVTPIAVDLANYENQPAAIIVLPDPTDSELLDVRVVGAGCSSGDDDLIVATRVPRP